MVVHVDEEILAKSGAELFRELLRVYSVAEVEDYFKAGQWRDDLMRTDIQLLYQHAREAGADDPTPLEEVKMPEMPRVATTGNYVPATVRAAVGVSGVRPASLTPTVAGKPLAVSAATAAAEVRLTAIFVAKWKLDATRTKLMLSKLTPLRRRYVIQKFNATPGMDGTAQLQAFITKCEATNAWPAATATAGSIRPAGLASMAGRPGATSIVGARASTGVRPASALGAVRPLGAGAARPVRPMSALGGRPALGVRPGGTPVAGVKRALTPGGSMGLPPAKRPQIVPKTAMGARPLMGGARPLRPAARPNMAPGSLISGLLRY